MAWTGSRGRRRHDQQTPGGLPTARGDALYEGLTPHHVHDARSRCRILLGQPHLSWYGPCVHLQTDGLPRPARRGPRTASLPLVAGLSPPRRAASRCRPRDQAVTYAELAARVDAVAARLGHRPPAGAGRRRQRRRPAGRATSARWRPGTRSCSSRRGSAPPALGRGVRPGRRAWPTAVLQRAPRRGSAHDLHPDLALLLSTSGSTGSPKLVRLSPATCRPTPSRSPTYLGIRADRPRGDDAAAALLLRPVGAAQPPAARRGAGARPTCRSPTPASGTCSGEHRRDHASPACRTPSTCSTGSASPTWTCRRCATSPRPAAGWRPTGCAAAPSSAGARGWDLVRHVRPDRGDRPDGLPAARPGRRPPRTRSAGRSRAAASGWTRRRRRRRGRRRARLLRAERDAGLRRRPGRPRARPHGRRPAHRRPRRAGPTTACSELVGRRSRFAKVLGLRIDLEHVEAQLGERGVGGGLRRGRRPAGRSRSRATADDRRAADAGRAALPACRPRAVRRRARRRAAAAAPTASPTCRRSPACVAGRAVPPAERPRATCARDLRALYAEVLDRDDVTDDSSFVERSAATRCPTSSCRCGSRRLLGHLPAGWHTTPSLRRACAGRAAAARRGRTLETSVAAAGARDRARSSASHADAARRRRRRARAARRRRATTSPASRSAPSRRRQRSRHLLRQRRAHRRPRAWSGSPRRRAAGRAATAWPTSLLLNGVLGPDAWGPTWRLWFLEALAAAARGRAALLAVPGAGPGSSGGGRSASRSARCWLGLLVRVRRPAGVRRAGPAPHRAGGALAVRPRLGRGARRRRAAPAGRHRGRAARPCPASSATRSARRSCSAGAAAARLGAGRALPRAAGGRSPGCWPSARCTSTSRTGRSTRTWSRPPVAGRRRLARGRRRGLAGGRGGHGVVPPGPARPAAPRGRDDRHHRLRA